MADPSSRGKGLDDAPEVCAVCHAPADCWVGGWVAFQQDETIYPLCQRCVSASVAQVRERQVEQPLEQRLSAMAN